MEDINVSNDFGDWLRHEMEIRRLTQKSIADMADISQPMLSRILNTGYAPGKKALKAIARALDLPEAYVFRRAGIMDEPLHSDARARQIVHMASQLPPRDQDEIIEILMIKLRRHQDDAEAQEVLSVAENLGPEEKDRQIDLMRNFLMRRGLLTNGNGK